MRTIFTTSVNKESPKSQSKNIEEEEEEEEPEVHELFESGGTKDSLKPDDRSGELDGEIDQDSVVDKDDEDTAARHDLLPVMVGTS